MWYVVSFTIVMCSCNNRIILDRRGGRMVRPAAAAANGESEVRLLRKSRARATKSLGQECESGGRRFRRSREESQKCRSPFFIFTGVAESSGIPIPRMPSKTTSKKGSSVSLYIEMNYWPGRSSMICVKQKRSSKVAVKALTTL